MAGSHDVRPSPVEGHREEDVVTAEEEAPVDFHHPYTPYDVQLDFMKTAYGVLAKGDGQVGILESPTGTGKSLSLICASLTWLRNHKKAQYEAALQVAPQQFKDEPDWVVEQMLRRKRADLVRRWEEREERLRRIRAKEKALEERSSKRRRVDGPVPARGRDAAVDEEAEFMLKDLDGGLDESDPLAHLSKETRALMEQVGTGSALKKMKEDDEDEVQDEVKIYYTSRTHSQLSQFISELRRPTFQSSLPESLAQPDKAGGDQPEGIRHIPLSSRQRLCINPKVARLGSLAAINDRCSELQQAKSKDKCPFAPAADNLGQTHQFRDAALAALADIEDLYRLGKQTQVCPYYASRTAIPGAEIVTLPYPLLLQKSARDALGIRLEGNIVIVDEAHNIMDAVAGVHAAELRLSELRRARQMLGVYVKRFGKKLKGANRVMVAQIAKVVDGLSEWMAGAHEAKGDQGIVDPNVLMKHKGIDQINLYKLIEYIQESKLAFKVESYASHVEEQQDTASDSKATSSPVLHTLVSFISALTNLSAEGRIFFEKLPPPSQHARPDMKLSYLLLSPTHAFSSIATSARAVILAGGTMSPFDDYKAHLFPYLPADKITTLSCGHVIPPSSLCVWTLASPRPAGGGGGAAGEDAFEFSFQKRGDPAMMRQLGLALVNICSVVPDGVVVFFPSYGYLDQVVAAWKEAPPGGGPHPPLWERLEGKKAVFRETKGGSSDEVLEAYTKAILGDGGGGGGQTPKLGPRRGALLLSVVGGKMSEGINFSDRLGRCVVIVGLPYPNINSPEWKARIEYIETSTLARLTGPAAPAAASAASDGVAVPSASAPTIASGRPAGAAPLPRDQALAAAKQAARDFYENACMRAVNQSIGRAIRHRGDYAAIVLADRRFGTERIRGKLPGWIRGGMVQGSEGRGLQGLMGALNGFFRGKKAEGR